MSRGNGCETFLVQGMVFGEEFSALPGYLTGTLCVKVLRPKKISVSQAPAHSFFHPRFKKNYLKNHAHIFVKLNFVFKKNLT